MTCNIRIYSNISTLFLMALVSSSLTVQKKIPLQYLVQHNLIHDTINNTLVEETNPNIRNSRVSYSPINGKLEANIFGDMFYIADYRILVSGKVYASYYRHIDEFIYVREPTEKRCIDNKILSDSIILPLEQEDEKCYIFTLLDDILAFIFSFVIGRNRYDSYFLMYMRLRVVSKRFRNIVDSDRKDITTSHLALIRSLSYPKVCPFDCNCEYQGSLYHFVSQAGSKNIFNAPICILKAFMYANVVSFSHVVITDRYDLCKKLLLEYIQNLKLISFSQYLGISQKLREMLIGTEMSISILDIDIINSLAIRDTELDKTLKIKDAKRVTVRSILQKDVLIYHIASSDVEISKDTIVYTTEITKTLGKKEIKVLRKYIDVTHKYITQ